MRPPRTPLHLLAAALFAACSMQLDLTGFTAACTAAPSDAAVELLFEGERLVVARVPMTPDALPVALHQVADLERNGERTKRVFREWHEGGRAWRLLRQGAADPTGQGRELLVDDAGKVLEVVHPVGTDRVPTEIHAAVTARGRLRIRDAAIVRSELRAHHWRFACEDGAGRPYCVESDLAGDDVRIARITNALAKAR